MSRDSSPLQTIIAVVITVVVLGIVWKVFQIILASLFGLAKLALFLVLAYFTYQVVMRLLRRA